MYIQKYYKVIRVIKDGDGGATPLYIENVSNSNGVFQLYKNGSPTYTPNLIYRIGDNGEWFEYDVTTLPSITVPSGSKIYFRGNNANGFNQGSSYYRFIFSQNYNLGGYITSLLALDNFNTITDIPQYSFYNLFFNNQTLLNAKDVITDNIINVGNSSFYNYFNRCTNLITAPRFENVTTVGNNGFQNCFEDCTSLVTAPTFESVTTVGDSGFSNCFIKCTSLVTAPRFENVTTVGNNGFYIIFYNCTSLQVVYTPNVTTWNTSNFKNWLFNVPPSGVIYKPANLTIPTGTNGVPEGWTIVDY
jgi:hypothetical protein